MQRKTSLKPENFEQAVHRVVSEIAELVIRKQHDYGHGNILAFGETGIIVRMSDKMERIKNFYHKEQAAMLQGKKLPSAQNEPKIDSFTDMAGYAIIELMIDKGWFELPLNVDCDKS